jgi:hypothetical protein
MGKWEGESARAQPHRERRGGARRWLRSLSLRGCRLVSHTTLSYLYLAPPLAPPCLSRRKRNFEDHATVLFARMEGITSTVASTAASSGTGEFSPAGARGGGTLVGVNAFQLGLKQTMPLLGEEEFAVLW